MKKKITITNISPWFALAGLLVGSIVFTSCSKRQVLVSSGDKAQTGQVLSVLKSNPAAGVSQSDKVDDNNANTRVNTGVASGRDDLPDENKGYFDYDSSVIRPDAEDVIKEFGEWMIDNPDAKLTIEGHADERGTREYNLALGARRANVTKRYIVNMGVAPNRIKTISYGKERPDDPRSNEDAWSKNRRFVALKIR